MSSNITRYDAIYSLVGGPLIGSQDGTKMNYEGGQTPPTEAEIDAEMIRMQNEFQALQYQRDRKYPNLGEQFDLLFHDMNAGKADKTGKWYETISKVKSDNPK